MKHYSRKKYSGNEIPMRIFTLLLFCFVSVSYMQAQNISGTVVDSSNEPLIGVSVVIKNTANGTITDIDGRYSVTVPDSKSTLVFSYIGYVTKEITVGNSRTINVVMEEDAQTLDEVVVVGYGTMKKRDLTGAVNSIRGESLEKDQPNTLQDMLRTGVAGLYVGIATDTKGNSDMLLRGKNNMRDEGKNEGEKSNNNPLVVLDGVIYPGEITDINPNDIEQIDVLKDASSAAVYGAKAANGVILITTKKGREGKAVINFNATVGLSFKNSLPEVYQGDEFVAFRQAVEESLNSGKAGGYYANPMGLNNVDLNTWMDGASGNPVDVWLTRLELSEIEIKNYKLGKYIDWERESFKNVALRQDYTVSISGRKNDMSYYSSLNYVKNDNNVKKGGYDAIRARINLEGRPQEYLTYGVNAQFTSRDEGYVSYSATGYQSVSPYGDMYEADGSLKLYPNNNLNGKNPLIDAFYTDRKKDINNLNASIYLKLNLPLGFSLQTTYSPRFEWMNYLNHESSEHPSWVADGGRVKRQQTKEFYWQWDNTLKWNKTFGAHAFDLTLLANWEKFQKWDNTMENKGFAPSDILGFGGIGFGTSPEVTADDRYKTGDAYMGRLHYVYDNKYLITATVRRDGYSAFGVNNPRATFPGVALGWVFSEENFFPETNWFEYGKLRASWGKNGNREIGEYKALMVFSPRKYLYVDNTTGELVNVSTYFSMNMANPNLKWETTKAFNVGLDFSFIRGRIAGSIDVYRKNTTDLLNDRKLPSITGFTLVTSNIGEVQNTGVEFSLNTTNIQQKNIIWRTNFNFAYNNNKIKHLYGLTENIKDTQGNIIGQKEADDIAKGYFIGHAIDEIWGYKVLGVWQESEREEAAKYGQTPGDMKIYDTSPTGEKDYKYDNTDKQFQGHLTPKVRFNMRNELTFFKNFTFSMSLYSYLGHKKEFNRAKNDGALLNLTNQIKRDYWTPENPTNDYARLTAKRPQGIDFSVYRNASFIRFDNISLGYEVPKSFLKNAKIERMNVNVTLRNVGYIAPGWPGEDPENSGKNTPRLLNFGINLTL